MLVVGGGRVALRKILNLIRFKANVNVSAPKAHERIERLAKTKKILLFKRKFNWQDLKNKDLVVCATNDPGLNQKISQACEKRSLWVNVVDCPELCSFIVPSVLQKGEVVFAVSTGGASPALAKFLRKRLDKIFGKELIVLSRALKKNRKDLLRISLKKRSAILNKILNEKVFKKLKQGDDSFLKKELLRKILREKDK